MALLEEEPKHSARILVFIGIPSFTVAVLISITTHHWAHYIAERFACGSNPMDGNILKIFQTHGTQTACPISALAGIVWTVVLAFISFAVYLHNPRNLFAGAMAFVNASLRLPETITVFLQLLLHNKARIIVDESSSLALIQLKDPTLSIVIMCFFSLTLIYLTVTIIHDTKTIPLKWFVALVLFIVLTPLEDILWRMVTPLIG